MAELWPFRPQAPVLERLAWLTDVMGSRTGEQRLKLRNVPRQSLDYDHRLDADQFSRAKAFVRRNGAVLVDAPVWPEAAWLGAVAADATSLSVDTTAADWREGGHLVVWESDSKFAVLEIDTVSSGSIALSDPVGIAFTRAEVMPVRSAYIADGLSIARGSTFVDASLSILVTDNVDLSASDYPQYESLDVVTERTIMVSDISEHVVRSVEMVDNGFGPVALETRRNYADFGQALGFIENGPAAVWRRRRWLHSLGGKQKPFWLPAWNMDLSLQDPLGSSDTVASVRSISPAATYVGRHVMVLLHDGTRFLRSITNAVPDGDNDDITLSASLGQAVTAAEIASFCFLSKVRLDSDVVSIEHRDTGLSAVTVPVMESPE